jgi:hypothetical protein
MNRRKKGKRAEETMRERIKERNKNKEVKDNKNE